MLILALKAISAPSLNHIFKKIVFCSSAIDLYHNDRKFEIDFFFHILYLPEHDETLDQFNLEIFFLLIIIAI